jgi:hypothetical protein
VRAKQRDRHKKKARMGHYAPRPRDIFAPIGLKLPRTTFIQSADVYGMHQLLWHL